ncbi:hypothetical protein CBR_g17686 [Chara braunii]|uniref:Uncharacterized protein n=1 Tax=Chara braunii TaxID=69332 RepID=A0A388KV77_CHABU|nr:hypothetical protein CBR_g17686 [Chara braunii]|eukprot:GBG73974.1 hypothetical protein CBR_g17686 [Chara braunii]
MPFLRRGMLTLVDFLLHENGLYMDGVRFAFAHTAAHIGVAVEAAAVSDMQVGGVPSCSKGGLAGCVFIILSRTGRLPENLRSLWSQLSGWTATLLFMFMPVAQLLSNLRNPEGMAGMSVLMVLLGLIGNALMIPRSIFTRDIIWFTGCTWATMMMGWGNLLCMYM